LATKRHPETISPLPVNYKHTVQALESALKAQHESLKEIEMLAARLRDMEANHPHLSSAVSQSNPRLLQAIHDVKTSIDRHGVTSSDTKRAWTKVETLLVEEVPDQATGVATEFSASTMSMAALQQEQHEKDEEETTTSTTDRYSESSLSHHLDYMTVLDPDLIQSTMESIEKVLAFEHFVTVEKRLLDKKLADI
jgi:hypothetical protein